MFSGILTKSVYYAIKLLCNERLVMIGSKRLCTVSMIAMLGVAACASANVTSFAPKEYLDWLDEFSSLDGFKILQCCVKGQNKVLRFLEQYGNYIMLAFIISPIFSIILSFLEGSVLVPLLNLWVALL